MQGGGVTLNPYRFSKEILPTVLTEGLLWRLALFASGCGPNLRHEAIVQGFRDIIETRLSGCRTSKSKPLRLIDITKFKQKLSMDLEPISTQAPALTIMPPPPDQLSQTLGTEDQDNTGM